MTAEVGGTPALALAGLRIRRGRRQTLAIDDLVIGPGEVVGLVGLDGAGKTTLLRACAGLLAPAAGSVRLFGADPRAAPARRALAYLPENHRPMAVLRGDHWARALLLGHGKTMEPTALASACQALALDPALLGRPVGQWSKGGERKLALAATLLAAAPLTLLDEPAAGLDPRARVALKDRLLAARAEARTVVLSSHLLADVEELCDRLLVLRDGTLIFDGPPAALCARYGGIGLERAFLAHIDHG